MLVATLNGRARRLEAEKARMGWLAWHIVVLDRTKRLPPLNVVTGEIRKATRAQTAEEMEAAARIWAGTFH